MTALDFLQERTSNLNEPNSVISLLVYEINHGAISTLHTLFVIIIRLLEDTDYLQPEEYEALIILKVKLHVGLIKSLK